MGEGGDGGAGSDDVLWEGASVVDDDVPHVGQHEEEEGGAELGSQDGCATSPQLSVENTTHTVIHM